MFTDQERQEIKLFLALLFPWDEEGAQLFKTVSWTFSGEKGVNLFANYATQSFDNLIRLIETRYRRAGANLYVATGTQRLASVDKFSADGFPKAIRQHNNIVSFKSIYLDVDVGKPGAYATTDDAFHAVGEFCQTFKLPEPTMYVGSGTGGLHVYWCFPEPVPVANWLVLARGLQRAASKFGLKYDPQVTVNPAGILRVPNTYNHKKTPQLLHVRLYDTDTGHTFPRYDYQQLVGLLGDHIDGDTTLRAAGGAARFARNAAFIDNVTEANAPPVSIDDVAISCQTIFEMLERGGNGDSEPLWNMGLYAAAFTTDPTDAAHRLSDQDPRYTPVETDKKLAEKIAARSDPKNGWPTCEQFSLLSTDCATCPLLVHKKTPFHHARRTVSGGGGDSGTTRTPDYSPMPGQDPLMPPNYWRNKDLHVWTTAYDKQGIAQPMEVIAYPILDAGIATGGELLFLAKVSGHEEWKEINVSMSMQPVQAAAALAKGHHGVIVAARLHAAARDFLLAWTTHLQNIKRTANQSAYGWIDDGKAFAFDDKIYREDRTDTVFRGRSHNSTLREVGILPPWQAAMKLIYGNIPLEVTVASAFGAPLVELMGPASLVMSLYSSRSGIGKTTALMLAQAVWGNPRSAMSALSDTNNAMMKKIGDGRNLPVYWDELRTKDQLEKVIEIVFQVTQGKGKARMRKDTLLEDVSIFTTMFVVASNHGIADTVYSQTESTEAGGLRVFEIEAEPLTPTMPDHEARQLMLPVQANYGVAGARYAEWLARHPKDVQTTLAAVSKALEATHKFKNKERYWSMTMTALLSGAILANQAGITSFDLKAIREYLGVELEKHRGDLKQQEYTTMAATQDVVGLLHEMKADGRNKFMIQTDTIHYGVGAPRIVKMMEAYDLTRMGDIWMQAATDGRIRVRARPFNEWLRKRKLNPKQILRALDAHYYILPGKQSLGVGVKGLEPLVQLGRTACIDFTPLVSASSPNPDS